MKRNNKKRIKTLLLIFLIELCLMTGILAFIVIYTENSRESQKFSIIKKQKTVEPEDILIKYMSYINKKNYDEMYQLISNQSKAAITKEEFIKRNKNIYEGIDAKDIHVKITKIENSQNCVYINYKTTMETLAGRLTFMNGATLMLNEKDEYRIEWGSELIFPNLSSSDKVKIVTEKGHRGKILDRNNKILAGTGTVASVGLVPGKIGENSKEDIKKISKLLNMKEDTINKMLGASYVKSDSFVPLKLISQSEQKLKDKLLRIPGVMITDKEVRAYPLGKKAAHLTGYVQNISAEELKELMGNYNENSIIGKVGLEKLYEDRLRGIDGCSINIMDKDGNRKETLAEIDSKDGEDIKLTIDADLQKELYNKLKNDKSSTVVMNPKTGEILALISTPAYDPNQFILGISSESWKKINEDDNKPMYNRFKAALCPGSSLKPIIAAIGLTTGKITHDQNMGYSGLSWQKDASWGNYKITTLKDYGNEVTMRNALIYSDNIYFAKAALKIGENMLAEQLLNLGFDERVPFEFGLNTSEFAADNKIESEIQLADSGYGQGKILVNPVHLASIYSAFVNEGNMVKPYLEYKEEVVPEFWKEHVFTKEAAKVICDDLIQVIENPSGTGHSAKISGLTLAGKTGTAEIKTSKEDTTGTELGWFVAFTVNEDHKQYLALSMIEDVKGRGGSHYVIPIIKSVFEQ